MGKFIVKLFDQYYEWSTVVDAPVTFGMSLNELRFYIFKKYGNDGLNQLPQRLLRVEEKGTSARDRDLESLIRSNRAGKDEKHLSRFQIYDVYKNYDSYRMYFVEKR